MVPTSFILNLFRRSGAFVPRRALTARLRALRARRSRVQVFLRAPPRASAADVEGVVDSPPRALAHGADVERALERTDEGVEDVRPLLRREAPHRVAPRRPARPVARRVRGHHLYHPLFFSAADVKRFFPLTAPRRAPRGFRWNLQRHGDGPPRAAAGPELGDLLDVHLAPGPAEALALPGARETGDGPLDQPQPLH